MLVRVAELLREQVRADDVVARTGGEEFVLLMPRTDDEEALACCERVRGRCAPSHGARSRPGCCITASFGVVTAPDAADLDGLARGADARITRPSAPRRDRAIGRVGCAP